MDETFVNVWFDKEPRDTSLDSEPRPTDSSRNPTDFYGKWIDKASAKHSSPALFGADALRHLFPKHSVVMTTDYRLNILSFPGASATPLEDMPLVTNLVFVPLARSLGSIPGVLADQIEYGAFKLAWDKYEFLLFTVQYPAGFGNVSQNYILHDGPEGPARSLLITVGSWSDSLHDEIWVFNQGFWQKDHGLWTEIQKADWKDVILKEEFKKTLQKDVYGFFASEEIYKELAIPWKRGLIMYGPPGNGKTISLKAIMKTCGAQGFAPLYVKSFQSYKGEEGAMADVFNKARQLAPCVVVLEDLDSLINDSNRSFFLNQLDGLEGNNGLLIIGTTNHFDRLDPGLSTRPSRFDRKFEFDDPDREERALYAKYWQKKLKGNKDILYPDRLVDDVADSTEHFSFAYLKEAFVSSLVTLAGYEGDDKPTFEEVLKSEIKILRKQLNKSRDEFARMNPNAFHNATRMNTTPRRPARPDNERDVHALLDALSDSIHSNRIFDTHHLPGSGVRNDRDIHALLDALSDSITHGDINSSRVYNALVPKPNANLVNYSASNDNHTLDGRSSFLKRDSHVMNSPVSPPHSGHTAHNYLHRGFPGYSQEYRGHLA